jgi:chromosomal replication initiation ATPase DnaA
MKDDILTSSKPVIDACAKAFSVSAENILSLGKTTDVAQARLVCSYILRYKKNGVKEIGKAINRHHSTVVYQLQKFYFDWETSAAFRAKARQAMSETDTIFLNEIDLKRMVAWVG